MTLQRRMSATLLTILAVLCARHAVAEDYAPHQVLVKFRQQATAEAVGGIYRKHLPDTVKHVAAFGIEKWEVSANSTVERAVAALRNDPAVEYAEPNYRRYPHAFAVTPTNSQSDWYSQAAYALLQIRPAWDIALNNGVVTPKPVIVAVFDSAIDIANPDIKPYLWTSADGKQGWDTINNDGNPSPGRCVNEKTGLSEPNTIDEPHGTWVTSVVAGMLQHIAMSVTSRSTPAPAVKLMGVRLGCYFTVSDELEAVDFAVKNGANIINASYGGIQYSQMERDGFKQLVDKGKNILLITSAGNYDGDNDRIPNYPANLDLPNILSVGASQGTGFNDKLTYWSHYGATSVDLAAPGDDVIVSAGTASAPLYKGERGTSFSAPLVSGIAALLMSAMPGASNATARQIRAALEGGVAPLGGKGVLATDGRVDAVGAMNFLFHPTPMVVIHSVRIDDTASGNRNSELDPGESADIVLALENLGTASSLTAQLSLESPGDGFIVSNQIRTVADLQSGGIASVRFGVQVPVSAGTVHRRLLMKLNITDGSYAVVRHFVVEYGPIALGQTQSGAIYTAYGNEQDDMQFLYVTAPPGVDYVTFRLECTSQSGCDDKNDVLDLLVQKGTPPRFDYDYSKYPDDTDPSAVSKIGPGAVKTLTALGGAGTYYVAVVVNPEYVRRRKSEPNATSILPIDYTLRADSGRSTPPKSKSFGCSMTGGEGIDPLLPLLLLSAATVVVWRRQQMRSQRTENDV